MCTIKVVVREANVVQYANDCFYLIKQQRIKPIDADKLRVELYIYPPDEKRRDVDNVCKAVLDALQHAGVYTDDFKLWQLYVERRGVRLHGEVEFVITRVKE